MIKAPNGMMRPGYSRSYLSGSLRSPAASAASRSSPDQPWIDGQYLPGNQTPRIDYATPRWRVWTLNVLLALAIAIGVVGGGIAFLFVVAMVQAGLKATGLL